MSLNPSPGCRHWIGGRGWEWGRGEHSFRIFCLVPPPPRHPEGRLVRAVLAGTEAAEQACSFGSAAGNGLPSMSVPTGSCGQIDDSRGNGLTRQIPWRLPHPDPLLDRWETKLQGSCHKLRAALSRVVRAPDGTPHSQRPQPEDARKGGSSAQPCESPCPSGAHLLFCRGTASSLCESPLGPLQHQL